MAHAEKRRQELLQRLSNSEEMNRRAAEKKQEEDAVRAEKHELRQREIAKSQQRLQRIGVPPAEVLQCRRLLRRQPSCRHAASFHELLE